MTVRLDRPQLELDPLIAEAKRRARQRRLLLLALAVAVTAGVVTGAVTLRAQFSTSTAGPAGKGTVDSVAPAARWVNSVGAGAGVVSVIDRHQFVWITMDNGRTWRVSLRSGHWPMRVQGKPFKVESPRNVAVLEQMQFVDKQHGWISALLDGGPVSIPPIDTRPWAIERTVDGGRTWRISWLPGCGCGNGFLSFYDARHGFVLAADRLGRGNPRVFRTSDGGRTWKLVGHAPAFGPITFLDQQNGILGTYPGTGDTPLGGAPGERSQIPAVLYRTTDGGATWSKERVPPPSFAFTPLPVSSFGRLLVVARGIYRNRPEVFTSADSGAHWNVSAPQLPANVQVSDFSAASSQVWAFVAPGRLYVTHDGGQSWDSIVPRGLPEPDAIYQPLVFSSPRVGWAVLGLSDRKELYRTTDGGRHWKPVRLRR